MFASGSSNAYRSDTAELPARADLFRHLVGKLVECEAGGWAHFESAVAHHWAEVAVEAVYLEINLSFPFKSRLEERFAEARISVPTNWRMKTFAAESWWRVGTALFEVPGRPVEDVVAFLDAVFARLYNEPEGRLTGCLDG